VKNERIAKMKLKKGKSGKVRWLPVRGKVDLIEGERG